MKDSLNKPDCRAIRYSAWRKTLACLRLIVAIHFIIVVSITGASFADDTRESLTTGMTRALPAIFDAEVLQDNFLAKLEATETQPPSVRYQILAKWVVPDDGSSPIRLPMYFSFPEVNGKKPLTVKEAWLLPVSAVVDLRSPGIELVRAAVEAGKLSDLRERILKTPPGETIHERRRQTLLIMLDLANDDPATAQQNLASVLSRLQTLDRTKIGIHSPETLAIFQGLQNEATREICWASLSVLVDSLIRIDRITSNDPWDRAILALEGWAKLRSSEDETRPEASRQFQLQQWVPVSRVTQRSTATGFPSANWVGTQGRVFNVTSHDEDYLYFQSPLRGDFEIECDVSTIQWQHSHLLVCGEWIAPVWGASVVHVGCVHRILNEVVIDPPMAPLDGWIRFRTVLRDNNRSTYINGRLVQEKSLSEDHDPWLAIRSPWYSEGGVRNLRITGRPEIPDTIQLLADPGLTQWIPGFDGIIGHDWAFFEDPSGGQIVGFRKEAGSSPMYRENVLHYHRPMIEDGTIEYEFMYKEGDTHVHPALDGLAFLLSPDGVCLHRLTNGVYDPAEADPALVQRAPASHRGPDKLPLKNGDWNRLQLRLTGSRVQVSLNKELVFEHEIEPADHRRFGLFHYTDQTQAIVRNIRWTGAWPTILPSEPEQELADPAQSYEELATDQVFFHSFVDQGTPENLFSMTGFLPGGSSASSESDGLQIQCRGKAGYIKCFVSPNVQVEGDFDLTAEFARLKTVADVNISSGVFLTARVNSTPVTEAAVYRGLTHLENDSPRQLTLSQVASLNSDGVRTAWSHPLSEESTSGRLRLMRRGKRIRCFFAEGDSSQFRLVSEEDVSDQPLTADGVRLLAATHESSGLTEVVWKTIEIRATKLTRPSVNIRPEDIDVLDRRRDQLQDSFVHDFTMTPPTEDTFHRWRDTRPWNKTTGGLKIISEGEAGWLTSGIHVNRGISGDFDVKVFVTELNLENPATGLVSDLYLVVPVSDKNATHATLHFRKLEDGRTVVIVGTGKMEAGERSLATIRTLDFKSVSALRVARHKGTLTCLVSSPDFKTDQAIASIEFPVEPILKGGIQVHLHTGGIGLESAVVIPRIEIRGNEITGD